MALERFLSSYQPGPKLLDKVNEEQLMLNNYDPPIIYLLDSMTKSSSDELKSAYKNNTHQDFNSDIDTLFSSNHEDIIGVIFGNTMKGLMEWHEYGFFDHQTFLDRLNNSFENTPLSGKFRRKTWLENEFEFMSIEKTISINKEAEKDPTFSFFFEKPENLPVNLRRYLKELQIFNYYKLPEIVSSWKEVAGHLAIKNNSTALDLDNVQQPISVSKELIKRPLYINQIVDILEHLDF